MKRTIIAAFVLALVAAFFSVSSAQADEHCTDVGIGQICASGDPAAPTGDVYADGNEDNPDPLDGYAGLNDEEGVVACANGDYDADHRDEESDGNNVVTAIPPAVPEGPPSSDGPCTPTGP